MKIKQLAVLTFLLTLLPCLARAQGSGTISTSGTDCSTTTACVVTSVPTNAGGSVINISSLTMGTLQFEGAAASGVYVALAATPLAGGTQVTSATANGAWRVTSTGLISIRVRASALSSGTPFVNITMSTASAGSSSGGGSSGGTPGGSNTQIQYNDAGSFGASAGLTWDKTSNTFTVSYASTDPGLIMDNSGVGLISPDGTGVIGVENGIVELTGDATLTGSLNGIPLNYDSTHINMALGLSAGNIGTATGTGSTSFGVQAGAALTIPGMGQTSADDTFVGYQAGLVCTTCRETTAIGYKAGGALIGSGAGIEDGLGTYIGSFAGVLDRGISNTMIGQKAGSGMAATSATNQDNVFVGVHAAADWTDGKQNVFIGRVNDDGNVSSTGDSNVVVGYNALFTHATSLNNNTCLGSIACRGYTNSDATMVGHNAGWQMTSGYQIALFGENAGQAETTANNITALGFEAAKNATAADITYVGSQACINGTSGANNTCLGSTTTLGAATDVNEIVIGKSAVGGGSNTTTIGNSSTINTIIPAGKITVPTYATATNCAANGTAANPSVVTCAAAAAGMFSCATAATTGTCQVNTTAVTANSEIFITQSAADGGAGQLNVTCNTALVLPAAKPILLSKSAGTSFTINLGTVTANPGCFEYHIVN